MATITEYVVKAGDTLSEIAQSLKSQFGYSSTYAFTDYLAELNNLTDPNYIVVGQTLKLSGTAEEEPTNTTSKPTIKLFGLQSNTDNTVYATWTWSKDNTEHYETKWYYDTGDSIWFVGNDSTTKEKQTTYSAPSNAKRVKFKVKAVSKTKTVNNKETSYWTSGWSTEKIYSFSDNPPSKPNTPTVEIKKFVLTATLDGVDETTTTHVQFQVIKDNNSKAYKTAKAEVKTGHVAYSCTVDAGSEYKVRCRGVKGSVYSDWSDYSSNLGTIPSAPTGITKLRALSETSVELDWDSVNNSTSYNIEYTTQKRYFDSSSEVRSMSVTDGWSHAEVTGLTSGEQYFFRVQAVNDKGESSWCTPESIVIGKVPAAPTTWSSTTTAITGENLNLYWVHNAQDNSKQTYAELELYINGEKETFTIANTTSEDEEETTSVYSIDTTSFIEGSTIQWRVRTAGITKEYGKWSSQRTIDIYAPPTLELNMIDGTGTDIETLTAFPFYISGLAGPNTQMPIGYHITVSANEAYETVDNLGNEKLVSKNEAVYSKYFDTNDPLMVEFSPSNIDLENNISYTVKCTVSMNSGLTAESSVEFNVAWTDLVYEPNAEINIDKDNFTATIMPYCMDENGNLIENITLSVYRREFDGTFTEIMTGLDNSLNISITDPHPALDFARYRIVAITTDTGAVSYCDLPGIAVGGIAAVIQWDEEWTSYVNVNEDAIDEISWTGSMLKLPYNIDVADSNSQDVALVKYAGRQEPTTYYGTQLGITQTWNVVIEKDDEETLYGLRRLMRYMGDVYIREPSGTGYWANVSVSFNQKHNDLTIPVSINITRVTGGV